MYKIADKLHKTAVTALMGLTVGTALVLTCQLYEFVNTTLPNKRKLENIDKPSEITGESLENSS